MLERRLNSLTTADLCFPAAEKLIFELGWVKDEIEAIIFVSQNTDYMNLQQLVFYKTDLDSARSAMQKMCSGLLRVGLWLEQCGGLVASRAIKKALLLAGDAKRRYEPTESLFGYAGTTTVVEYSEGAEGFKCHFGTDGSSYDAIIIPDGGARNQISEHSFVEEEIEGQTKNRLQLRMKGMDVFSFGITVAPKSIKKLAERYAFNYNDADYLILHQVNMMMNNKIAKKLKLDAEKVPSCMYNFGNTSSASIPLTIVTKIPKDVRKENKKILACGFSVGLSWGTIYFCTDKIVVPDLVEVENPINDMI